MQDALEEAGTYVGIFETENYEGARLID